MPRLLPTPERAAAAVDRAATRIPRAVRIGVPAAIIGVAAATRLIGLDSPATLVFDETYYVKDAASMLAYGYEGRWPDESNPLFESGALTRPDAQGAFVAHPPFGKWLIAAGLAAFGTANPVGWRISTALAGIVLVALVMLLAHLLLKNFTLSMVVGGLIAIDGNAIVMSRVALLDGLLAVTVVAAVIMLVKDRADYRAQLAARVARSERYDVEHPPPNRRARDDWGPAIWARPWLIAFGATFGLAASIKWSALYLFAAFALLSVALDALDRRYLHALVNTYAGGPVGVETLAAALSEARDAVEDVIEPYLMQRGYVARTPRGRVAAPLAYERLGLPVPGGQQSGLFGEK